MTPAGLYLEPAVRDLLVTAASQLSGREGYLVGGSLRDGLLRLAVRDLDLAVDGDSVEYARALADRLGADFALLDDERGTARVILRDAAVAEIDVTRLQGEIQRDLAFRDFTIDALAVSLADIALGGAPEIIDPLGGTEDLGRKMVRLVSEQALIDDPLRLLRAVRLAVQLDFTADPSTADAVRRHAGRIVQAAPERQRDELAHMLSTHHAAEALRLLDGFGLLELLLPEVAAGRGVTQPKEHHWDVFDHNVETVATLDWMLSPEAPQAAPERDFYRALWDALGFLPSLRAHFAEEVSDRRSRAALLKFAGLLHDVAKPETRAPDETGRIRFFGHSERGAETARAILRRFRFSRREVDLVSMMVDEHLRPGQLGQDAPPTRRALFRYFRDTRSAAESILFLFLADGLAARGPRTTLDAWERQVRYVAHVLARRHEDETIAKPQRLVSGDDLITALGLGPGPEIGRVLAAIEDAQGAGEITTREEAIEFARRHGEGQALRSLSALRPARSQALVAAGDVP
jgi:tRNA nucleotidyltransferase/poly(A) polymerase